MKSSCRNIVITGANSGIGAELARLYAGKGVNLGLVARDLQRLEKIVDECRANGSHVEYASIDVSDQESLGKWLLKFDDDYPIELVIAGAGIINTVDPEEPLESYAGIRKIFDTNLFGVIFTINPLIERMRSRNHGVISVISSLSAYRGVPLFPAYSASKASVKSYYEGLRAYLKDYNIAVSIACPGFVETPMTSGFRNRNFRMITAQKAARIIKNGIDKRKTRITFPLLDLVGLYLLGVLPTGISDWIMLKIMKIKKP